MNMLIRVTDSAIVRAIGLILIIAGIYFTTPLPSPPEFNNLEPALDIEATADNNNLPDVNSVLLKEGAGSPVSQLLEVQPMATTTSSSTNAPKEMSLPAEEGGENNQLNQITLSEKEINIKAIVLVRCLFQTQFYASSTQPWNEARYNIGSGIIISPDGHILTARHLLEIRRELRNDLAGRVWVLKGCEIAQTDEKQTEIPPVRNWQQNDSMFEPVEIIFKTSDEDYADSAGLDFAILKLDRESKSSYINLFPQLLLFEKKAPIIAIGYPGRESASAQKLERFDGEFLELTYYQESSCDGSIKPCGLRYSFRRYPLDYQKDFWKPTELGIVTPYFRGGFSGAPAFFGGNLIGIVTHGRSGDQTESGWDEVFILTSYDVVENLKAVLGSEISL